MPSVIDRRRLRDGAHALAVSARTPATIAETRAQLEVVSDGIAAMQSLDDLGPEGNAQAMHDHDELWKRYKALKEQLADLEQREGKG